MQLVRLGEYSPLFLSGTGWSIEFRLTPTPKIIRKGQQPPLEEMVKAVAACGMPALLVQIVQVVAACTPDCSDDQTSVRTSTVSSQISPAYHAAWRRCEGLPPLAPKDTTWSTGDTDPDRPVSGFPVQHHASVGKGYAMSLTDKQIAGNQRRTLREAERKANLPATRGPQEQR